MTSHELTMFVILCWETSCQIHHFTRFIKIKTYWILLHWTYKWRPCNLLLCIFLDYQWHKTRNEYILRWLCFCYIYTSTCLFPCLPKCYKYNDYFTQCRELPLCAGSGEGCQWQALPSHVQCEETATQTRDLPVTGGKTLPLAPGPPFRIKWQ